MNFLSMFLISAVFVRLPDIYTQFRKVVEGQCRVRPVLSTPEQVKSLPLGLEEGAIPTFEGLGQTGTLIYIIVLYLE